MRLFIRCLFRANTFIPYDFCPPFPSSFCMLIKSTLLSAKDLAKDFGRTCDKWEIN